jgi:hypothetical protein
MSKYKFHAFFFWFEDFLIFNPFIYLYFYYENNASNDVKIYMGRHQIITWMKHIFKYHPNGLL